MTLNKQATDQFLYNRVIPRLKEPLTGNLQIAYELLKARMSGGMDQNEAIKEVAKLLNLSTSSVRNRLVSIRDKGWL